MRYMASTAAAEQDLFLLHWVEDSDHVASLASLCELDEGALCESAACHQLILPESDEDLVWSNAARHWADIDIDAVVSPWVDSDPDLSQQARLWRSIDDLKTSNLSRLVRVVRDWHNVSTAEEEPTSESNLREAVDSAEPLEPQVSQGIFLSLLHDSNHELLEREAGKDVWTWFADWRDLVLSLAERFEALSGEEVFNLLKSAVASRRSAPRARAPRQRRARSERLVRLAQSITPHAPPCLSQPEALPTGAG